jgi:hypothetical protein
MNFPLTDALPILVALFALWFTVKQFSVQRDHNKLSVRPHLVLEAQWKDSTRFAFLKNVGLGPAEIINHKVVLDGKEIPFKVADDISSFADAFIGGGFYSGGKTLERGMVIEAGKRVAILVLDRHEQHEYHEAKSTINKTLEKLCLEVEYSSFYKEKFQMQSRAFVSPDDYSFY